jgi:aryl sulfotransferase
MLVEPARHEYRSWTIDSRRWKYYRPRPDDIIIATYPKCGTTWTQQIVSLLVFQTPEPKPVMQISAWIDRRFGEPIEAVLTQIEAQEHRRFLKSHLPLDCLPFYDEVKYIHVARDGRDACMSLHNHGTGLSAQVLEAFDKIGLEDETIGHPFPRLPEHPAEFFHQWITAERFGNRGGPMLSFFHFQRTWWEVGRWSASPCTPLRQESNVAYDLLFAVSDLIERLKTPGDKIVHPGSGLGDRREQSVPVS